MKSEQKPEVTVKTMWNNGPLRRWSAPKTTLTPMGYGGGGFVGSYVCSKCLNPCDGVYLIRGRPREELKWLCGPCKSKVEPLERVGGDENIMRLLRRQPDQDGHR